MKQKVIWVIRLRQICRSFPQHRVVGKPTPSALVKCAVPGKSKVQAVGRCTLSPPEASVDHHSYYFSQRALEGRLLGKLTSYKK